MRNIMLDALFPKTRQMILATLLAAPERRWYVSDLAKHLRVPPSSLQRELAALSGSEILSRKVEGKHVYFQANPANPIFPDLQSLFVKTSGLTDPIKAAIEPFLSDIDIAFIFGSVAKSSRTAQSDIDVMIIGNVGLSEIALPLRKVQQALNMPVNLVHYSVDEFRDKVSQNNHFLQTVILDSKIFLKGSEHDLAIIADKPKNQSALNQ